MVISCVKVDAGRGDYLIIFKKVKAFFIRVKTSLESEQCAIHIK